MCPKSVEILPGIARALATVNTHLGFAPHLHTACPGTIRVASRQSASTHMLHRTLRAATRIDHAMVDRLMSRFDLSRREDYSLFLQVHYWALKNLDTHWRDEDYTDFAAMIACLHNDLRALTGVTTERRELTNTAFLVAHHLGIAYVIRGSRLGAAFVRRRVAGQFPTSYLDFVPTLPWGRFLDQLELASDSKCFTTDDTIRGARMTFEMFAALLTPALA